MPVRIYPFSCGLLMTQVLVFLSKGLLVGYFQILFHLLGEQSIPCLRDRTPLVRMPLPTLDIHHILWLSPSQVSSNMELCALLLFLLVLGGGSGKVSITLYHHLLSEPSEEITFLVFFFIVVLKIPFVIFFTSFFFGGGYLY